MDTEWNRWEDVEINSKLWNATRTKRCSRAQRRRSQRSRHPHVPAVRKLSKKCVNLDFVVLMGVVVELRFQTRLAVGNNVKHCT
jgi:hypothetical protein